MSKNGRASAFRWSAPEIQEYGPTDLPRLVKEYRGLCEVVRTAADAAEVMRARLTAAEAEVERLREALQVAECVIPKTSRAYPIIIAALSAQN